MVDEAGLTERSGVLQQKCEELTKLFGNIGVLLRVADFEDVDDVFKEDKKHAEMALKGGLKDAKAAASSEAAEKVVVGLEKGVKRAVREVPEEPKWVRLL